MAGAGAGASAGLVIGGAILAAVALAVVAFLLLGGDDDDDPIDQASNESTDASDEGDTTDGDGDDGEDRTTTDGFPDTTDGFSDDTDGFSSEDVFEEAFGISEEQAECLAERIEEAVEDGDAHQRAGLHRHLRLLRGLRHLTGGDRRQLGARPRRLPALPLGRALLGERGDALGRVLGGGRDREQRVQEPQAGLHLLIPHRVERVAPLLQRER